MDTAAHWVIPLEDATDEDEAREILDLGRLSWRLRDDDNLLVGRLESQRLRVLEIAAARLCDTGRLRGDAGVTPAAVPVLADALRSADAIANLPTPDRPAHPASRRRKDLVNSAVSLPVPAWLQDDPVHGPAPHGATT